MSDKTDGKYLKMNKKIKQCKAKWWSKEQCQGASGHKNWHWLYEPNGSLTQWRPKGNKDKPKHIGASTTPPEHKNYIHPKNQRKKYYWINLRYNI